jgi:hypothetical protein
MRAGLRPAETLFLECNRKLIKEFDLWKISILKQQIKPLNVASWNNSEYQKKQT